MKTKIIIMLAIVVGAICFTSCEDFLAEKPYSFLSPENFFDSQSNATAALLSVYASLGNDDVEGAYWNKRIQELGFWASDIGTSNTGNAEQHSFIEFNWSSSNSYFETIWETSYNTINRANFVIDNVGLMSTDIMSDSAKNIIIGEARFLRGLMYFDLVQLFGPVPLKLKETKSEEDAFMAVSTEKLVYDAIVDDLLFCKDNMAIYERGTSDAGGRADRAAAKALLGKVYLTMAGFPLYSPTAAQSGLDILNELISEASVYGVGLQANYADAFEVAYENGKEDIFSVQFKKGLGSASAGSGSLLHIQAAKGGAGSDGVSRRGNWMLKVTPKLVFSFLNTQDSLDIDDERYQLLRPYQDIGGKILPVAKYPSYTHELSTDFTKSKEVRCRIIYKFIEQEIFDQNTSANDGDKNIPVIRWAEVLLLAAECENMVNGATPEAYGYLKEVRDRANASDAPSGMTQEEFADYILDERLRELHGEGQRFFDLKRTQKLISEVQESLDDYSGQKAWSKMLAPTEKSYYFPYPLAEVNYNDNITQRLGY